MKPLALSVALFLVADLVLWESRSLHAVIAGAKAQLDRVRFLSLADPDWPGMILGQHRDIVACVLAGDGAGAAQVMQAHLHTAFAAIHRIAAQHPAFFEGADTVGAAQQTEARE